MVVGARQLMPPTPMQAETNRYSLIEYFQPLKRLNKSSFQRNDCEEEDILLTSSSSRWRRVREAGQSAGSLSLTRWCSDLVTWDEDDFYDKDEEDFYNSHDEVNDFLLNDLTEQELKRQK